MLSVSNTLDDIRNEIETYDFWGFDYANVRGYQDVDLSSSTDIDDSGLSATTQYYFKVNGTEYDITTASALTYADIITLIEIEIDGDSYNCKYIDNKMRFTNLRIGANSDVTLTAGTTGTDLFASLADWSAFDTAVSGNTRVNNFEYELINAVENAKYENMIPSITESDYDVVAEYDRKGLTTEDTYIYRAELYFSIAQFLNKIVRDEKTKIAVNTKDVRLASQVMGKARVAGSYINKAKRNLYLAGYFVTMQATRTHGIHEGVEYNSLDVRSTS
jgi:hypothetical protein